MRESLLPMEEDTGGEINQSNFVVEDESCSSLKAKSMEVQKLK